MARSASVMFLCLLLPINESTAESWQDDPKQHVTVLFRKRLYGHDKIFTSYKPQKTRLLRLLGGYKKTADTRLSKYGGRLDRRTEARGFFYVKKIGRRWWLVDPDGHLFVAVALNGVRPGPRRRDGSTGVAAFGKRWKNTEAWAKETVPFLRRNGFNALGAWSDESLSGVPRPLVRAEVIYLMRGLRNYCVPVLGDDFEALCRKRIKKLITREMIQDPGLLGYFVDNELPWREDSLKHYLSLDKDDINCRKALEWLFKERRIKSRLSASADKIKSTITPLEKEKFLGHITERYYSIVSKVVKERDRNHLYLGSRVHGQAIRLKPVFVSLGRYADVISVNYYHRWTPRESDLKNWQTWSAGKPFLISEMYVKGADTGRKNVDGAGGLVPAQKDRGMFYQNFTLGLLEWKSCVGWSWHVYRDTQDPPRGSNKGFLDVKYKPFSDLLDMAREINTQVYPLVEYFDKQ